MGDRAPQNGKTFNGHIHRISSSGNGIIETKQTVINVGPVLPGAEGEYIEALKLPGPYARCNTRRLVPDDYLEQINEQFPHDLPLGPGKGNVGNIIESRRLGENGRLEKFRPLPLDYTEDDKVSASNSESDSPPKGTHTVEVDRISSSGNGIAYVDEHEFNLGPLPGAVVGETVEIKITGGQTADCLTDLDTLTDSEEQDSGTQPDPDPGEDNQDSDVNEADSTSTEDKAVSESSESENSEDARTSQPDLEELRAEAESDAEDDVTVTRSSTQEYARSTKVQDYVKARAEGQCEGCGDPAPFTSTTGEPYLHAHHVNELSKGGSDSPDTVIALCPNCHYRVHHGEDGSEYNQELIERLTEIEG